MRCVLYLALKVENNSFERCYYCIQYFEWHLVYLEISVTKYLALFILKYNNNQRGDFEGSYSCRSDNNGAKY